MNKISLILMIEKKRIADTDYFVLITLKDNKKYVISPKNKEDFCKIFST